MTLAEYIQKYYPEIDPRLWRGIDCNLLKIYLESLFWRLGGYKTMVHFPIEQVQDFLEQANASN
jgi:hypothetical protein